MPKTVLIPYRDANRVKPYLAAAAAAGLEAYAADVSQPVKLADRAGLLLTGGTDVNPKLYGEQAGSETDKPDDPRDQVELELMGEALDRDIPILAICRGLQLLNVYHGGDLIQHLGSPRHDVATDDKGMAAHPVCLVTGSLLHDIAGVTEWCVNSRHHQAVRKVGLPLAVAARDSIDGTVEALERNDRRFVIGVQWHPEDQVRRAPEQLKLFFRFGSSL